MKLTGKIRQTRIDVATRKTLVTLEINETKTFQKEADDIISEDVIDIELKKHRNKRSLSANAYAWVLIDRLAEETGIPKETIYRDIIRNVGGNTATVKVASDAADKLLTEWTRNGLGWFGEEVTRRNGFSEVTLYYGSSTFDTKQMSRLIELVIQECSQENISTETLERIAYLEGLLNR